MYLYNQLQMTTFLFVARKSRTFRWDEQEILQKQKMIDSYRRVGNPIWDLIQDFIQDFIQTGDGRCSKKILFYLPIFQTCFIFIS